MDEIMLPCELCGKEINETGNSACFIRFKNYTAIYHAGECFAAASDDYMTKFGISGDSLEHLPNKKLEEVLKVMRQLPEEYLRIN